MTANQSAKASLVHWYVAVAQPGMDIRVGGDLASQGYEVHLAKIWARKSGPNYAHIVRELRLSPYVFVAVDERRKHPKTLAHQNLQAVRDTLGVGGVISLALDRTDDIKWASEVSAETVRGLRIDEEISHAEACKPPSRQKESPYRVNDEVIITANGHLFEGMRGRVKDARNSSVIVELGASNIPVRFDIGEVSPEWLVRKRA